MQSDSQRKRTFLVLLFLSLFKGFENTEKRKNKKKLPKIFGRYALKFLPLHPLSEKNSNRETSDLEQIYINNTSSTRAGASQINNWKLMIKARRTWVKQKNRQYLFYINR